MSLERKGISLPSAELWGLNGKPAWFCIRTHLKHEHIAAAHVIKIPGTAAFNPQLKILRSTRQGRRWNLEPLFPNYIFVRFVLISMLEKIRHTPGVKTVLQFGGEVPEIPEAVIEDLRQSLSKLEMAVVTDAPLEGDEVEIATGAFKGITGQIARVLPAKQRIQILLEVMGRSVIAELGLDSILFNKRGAAALVLPPPEFNAA